MLVSYVSLRSPSGEHSRSLFGEHSLLNTASSAPVRSAQGAERALRIAGCGLRVADCGRFFDSRPALLDAVDDSEHPQSAIFTPCSLLIHLFREKTGSKFSARPLIHWRDRSPSLQVASRPLRQKILFKKRDR